MGDLIRVLFYARKSKTSPNGLTPIYMRVTVNGQRFEAATSRFIKISKWSQEAGKASGDDIEANELNEFLDVLRTKAFDIQKKLIIHGSEVSIGSFAKHWHGTAEKPRMLLEIFQFHNDQVKELVGQQYASATNKKYKTSLDHTRKFIQEQYGESDIAVTRLKYSFITDYEFWLKSKRKCNHNSTITYLTNFKKIIHICLKNTWLDRDPFIGFKMSKKEVERPYLTTEELEKLANKSFVCERLNQVRDIFLFSCDTGLAYTDTRKLSPNEIGVGIDSEKWIFTHRQKTGLASSIPLLPQALSIVSKYENHPQCRGKNRLLPLLSNQKMNAYLHEIADL